MHLDNLASQPHQPIFSCLCIYRSVSVHLLLSASVRLFLYLYQPLCICLSISISLCASVSLSLSPFVCLFLYLYLPLCACFSVYLSLQCVCSFICLHLVPCNHFESSHHPEDQLHAMDDEETTSWPTSSTDDDGWSLFLFEGGTGEAGVVSDSSAAEVFWGTSSNESVSDCGWIEVDNESVACLLEGLDANQSHLFDEEETAAGSSSDRQYWAMMLIVFPMFTVFGNVLVVLSVWREKSLQSVTNYFIVSLAISDIMVAMLVMPLSIYVEVSDNSVLLVFCLSKVLFQFCCKFE